MSIAQRSPKHCRAIDRGIVSVVAISQDRHCVAAHGLADLQPQGLWGPMRVPNALRYGHHRLPPFCGADPGDRLTARCNGGSFRRSRHLRRRKRQTPEPDERACRALTKQRRIVVLGRMFLKGCLARWGCARRSSSTFHSAPDSPMETMCFQVPSARLFLFVPRSSPYHRGNKRGNRKRSWPHLRRHPLSRLHSSIPSRNRANITTAREPASSCS